ncbi:hypothetical protein [Phaffia rhodozyma]|uniref:Uncharacterized protein n=1 Tax=Phaffia rhodozyma TaxID=264483 RepID=A0A0F7SH35_PHARH|nr:hypothetical protein [Phaffia rhodozyma]
MGLPITIVFLQALSGLKIAKAHQHLLPEDALEAAMTQAQTILPGDSKGSFSLRAPLPLAVTAHSYVHPRPSALSPWDCAMSAGTRVSGITTKKYLTANLEAKPYSRVLLLTTALRSLSWRASYNPI